MTKITLDNARHAVKRASALERQITFINKQRGLTDRQKDALTQPMREEQARILADPEAEQGTLDLVAPDPGRKAPKGA